LQILSSWPLANISPTLHKKELLLASRWLISAPPEDGGFTNTSQLAAGQHPPHPAQEGAFASTSQLAAGEQLISLPQKKEFLKALPV
jgi:hypothetical protein